MAWVTLMYHGYLWLVDTHGEDGNVLTRRCLGNTSVTQVMFYFFMWVVFIRVCSLCNNSLSCSVHHNLITIFTKKKKNKTKLQIEWKQRCKHSLLLLSRFSHVWLCATPEMTAHQAPPSLGFSRQEHWSGLPFPSPMHESEKGKWSRSVVSDS